MIFWVDAQLFPHLAPWLSDHFPVQAFSASRLGLRDASDQEIFLKAREAKATVITKDQDFVALQDQLGPPPQVLWLTVGNTSNFHLKALFLSVLDQALDLLRKGEPLVQIHDPR